MDLNRRKCYVVMQGKPCPYLADDGTCLLKDYERKEKCLALEKISHEEKDEEWFNRVEQQGEEK